MVNKFITSTQNPLIKQIQLMQTKKSARKKENSFVIEGIKSVNEIPEQCEIKYLIMSEHIDQESITVTGKDQIVVPEDVYKHISDTKTPQGAMAIAEMTHRELDTIVPKENGFYMILENVQDPGNLGTIIRTAYGFGVDAIFMTKGSVDLYNPKTIRSTMGAVFHIPIVMDYSIEEYVEWMSKNNIRLFATDLEGSKPLAECQFTESVAIVIGNEANGISDTLRACATNKVRIPMPGGLESLNASIAASICMYEVMRQRQ